MKSRSWSEALRSFADPMTYFQVVRLLHFYSYTHVRPRRKLTLGEGATIAPNVSLRNGERITIGRGSKIGERAYIWAGDSGSSVTIGEDCRFGPEVFVTASDYGLSPDAKIAEQERNERDVVIGNDVWLGRARLRRRRRHDRRRLRRQRRLGGDEVAAAGLGRRREPGADRPPPRGLRGRRSQHGAGERSRSRDDARVSPDVSILIVTYRCRDAARACLESLRGKGDGAYEIVVLDNASGDGTVEMVRSEFPDVRLIASEENLGFALGCNRAAEEARGEYLLLLNPDTVVHEGAVANLLAFARAHPEHGLYGGRTLDPDGSVNPGSCWGAPTLWSLFCFATLLTSAFKRTRLFDPESLGGWKRDTVREVDIVTGCLLLAPRAALGGARRLRHPLLHVRRGRRPLAPRGRARLPAGDHPRRRGHARDRRLLGRARGQAPAPLPREDDAPAQALARPPAAARARPPPGGARAPLAHLRAAAQPCWTQVWRSRSDWLAGYPEAAPAPPPSASREIGAAR